MLQANPAATLRSCDNTTLVIDPAALGSVAVDSVIVGVLDTVYTAGPSECTMLLRRVTAVSASPGGLVIESVAGSWGDVFFSANLTFPEASTTQVVPNGPDTGSGFSLSNTTVISGRKLLNTPAIRGHALSRPSSFEEGKPEGPEFEVGVDLGAASVSGGGLQLHFSNGRLASYSRVNVFKAPGGETVITTFKAGTGVAVTYSATIQNIKTSVKFGEIETEPLSWSYIIPVGVIVIPVSVLAKAVLSGSVAVEGDYESPVELTGVMTGGPSVTASLTCTYGVCIPLGSGSMLNLDVTGMPHASGICGNKFTLEAAVALEVGFGPGVGKATLQILTAALQPKPSVTLALKAPDDKCPCVNKEQQASRKVSGVVKYVLEVFVGAKLDDVGIGVKGTFPIGETPEKLFKDECTSDVEVAACELGKCDGKDKGKCGDKKAGAAKHTPQRAGRHLMQTDQQDAITALQVSPEFLLFLPPGQARA